MQSDDMECVQERSSSKLAVIFHMFMSLFAAAFLFISFLNTAVAVAAETSRHQVVMPGE